jgi:hypothetical protein
MKSTLTEVIKLIESLSNYKIELKFVPADSKSNIVFLKDKDSDWSIELFNGRNLDEVFGFLKGLKFTNYIENFLQNKYN